jgi:hypothetical protein
MEVLQTKYFDEVNHVNGPKWIDGVNSLFKFSTKHNTRARVN